VQGYIQAADTGTLFLDEVAELDLRVQAKLLRVLETREVLPLGATRAEPVQLRVCVAAHADLAERVAAGQFREDLYYRVGRPVVQIPPLRERLDEMAWLIQREIASLSQELSASVRLVEACAMRAWPGNVRELIGEIRLAAHRALTAQRAIVDAEDLAEDAGRRLEAITAPPAAIEDIAAVAPSDEAIEQALQEHTGNVTQTARALGMHRNQLRRWLAKHPLIAQRLPRGEP
jgi:transcriptional regulator with PAS, ATPase and Fis domain